MALDDLENIKIKTPCEHPVDPVEWSLDSEFRSHGHKGIFSINACCGNIDRTLTPYDIKRLKRRMNRFDSPDDARQIRLDKRCQRRQDTAGSSASMANEAGA